MNGRVLLDTNIIIALFAKDAAVLAGLKQATDVFVSSTALGELYYGAEKSAQSINNLARVDEFAAASAVLSSDATTARHYGRIKNALRAKGRPLPENDIWIAATAIQFDLTLVTRDHRFQEIDGIALERW